MDIESFDESLISAHTKYVIELASASRTSSAEPRAYFSRWVDHDSWPEWSPDTEWVHLDGPVRAGTRGRMKPVGGPKTTFTISECETDRVYTDVSTMPGAALTFRHVVEPSGSGSVLTVRVSLEGALAWVWARTAFRGLAVSVPEDLDRLIAIVEAS